MTIPSRQGLEQLALVLAVGAALFGLLALWRWRRGLPWRRHLTSVGVLGTLVVVVLAVAYTVAPSIPTPPVPLTARFAVVPLPADAATIAAGRGTFQARCVICHGPRGRGDGPAAQTMVPKPVDLTVHVPQHALGEIEYWISEGVAGTQMPSWKEQLSDTERWQLVRFLEALAAGKA